MWTKLLCLLMFFSATAFAQSEVTVEEDWEGASKQLAGDNISANQFDANAQLELSNPWYYGREDSDTLVNRDRVDTQHD